MAGEIFEPGDRVVIARGFVSLGSTGTVQICHETEDGLPWYEVLMDHDWIPWHVVGLTLDPLDPVVDKGM